MEDNNRIRNTFTVCKFIVNSDSERSRNRIITKTLGKFGVINMDYRGPCPKHDELWLVKIDKEIKSNEALGCLVLTPIMQLDVTQVHPIIPGTGHSTEHTENGVCYVTPLNPDKYYMIPIGYRKANRSARFMICVHRGYGDRATPVHRSEGNPYAGETDPVGWTPEAVENYTATRGKE